MLWLGLTLPRKYLQLLAGLTAVVALWFTAARLPTWKAANRSMSEVAEYGRAVPAGSLICEIDLIQPSEAVDPLAHAVDRMGTMNIVDVADYEAGRKAFWTRFKPKYYLDEDYAAPSSVTDLQGSLERFEQRTGKSVEFLLFTNLQTSPERSIEKLLPRTASEYRLVRSNPPAAALFRRVDADGTRLVNSGAGK